MTWRVIYSNVSSKDFSELDEAKKFLRTFSEGRIFEFSANAHPSLRYILRYTLENNRVIAYKP